MAMRVRILPASLVVVVVTGLLVSGHATAAGAASTAVKQQTIDYPLGHAKACRPGWKRETNRETVKGKTTRYVGCSLANVGVVHLAPPPVPQMPWPAFNGPNGGT